MQSGSVGCESGCNYVLEHTLINLMVNPAFYFVEYNVCG